jgi:hypothetical protein
MEMTVSNGLGTNRIRSQRTYDTNMRRIDFTLETVPTSPGRVSGSWVLEDKDGGTSLTVTHIFHPDERMPIPEQKKLTEHLTSNMHENTEHALQALKVWVEHNR